MRGRGKVFTLRMNRFSQWKNDNFDRVIPCSPEKDVHSPSVIDFIILVQKMLQFTGQIFPNFCS